MLDGVTYPEWKLFCIEEWKIFLRWLETEQAIIRDK